MNSSKSGGSRRDRRTLTRLSTLGVAALAAGAVTTPAANATIGPAGVADGHNITVFHNIDFVAAFGNPGNLTLDVIRNGVNIGTATGPTVDTPEGPGLEVNHGPAGPAQPGDCFNGHTPDVLPGDLIRVTNNTVPPTVDEVIVDDIGFRGQPVEDPATGNVLVHGFARRANGTAIPTAFLDSAEFRGAADPKLRGTPDQVIANAAEVGGFTMVYEDPWTPDRNENNLNAAQIKAALLGDGHATGFGHVAVLPRESMLVDGLTETPGPAPGCVEENSIIGTDDGAVNIGSGDLVVNGGRRGREPACVILNSVFSFYSTWYRE